MSTNLIKRAFDNFMIGFVPNSIRMVDGSNIELKLIPDLSTFENFVQKMTQRLFYLCYNIWLKEDTPFGGRDKRGADFIEWFMENGISERLAIMIKEEYGKEMFLKFKDLDGYEVNDLTPYTDKLKKLGWSDCEKQFDILQGHYAIIGGVIRMVERLAEFNDIPIYNEDRMIELKQIQAKVLKQFEVVEKALPSGVVGELKRLRTDISEITDTGNQIKIRLKGKLNAGEIRFYPKEKNINAIEKGGINGRE